MIDSGESNFAVSVNRGPLPRWQRKALEAAGVSSDRFIPDRANMDMEACKYNLSSSSTTSGTVESPSKLEVCMKS